jgi:outer membrane lipoprotein-sorting protein
MKALKNLFILLLTFVSISTLRAETPDEIITKHIAAIGGADSWKKLNSKKFEGTVTANGAEIGVTGTFLYQKGMRMDISMMGMTGYQILTPTGGWTFMPFAGQTKPEAFTAEDVKEGQDELDIRNELIDYQAKGHTAEYLGKEDVEGTECYKIKLTRKDGKVKTLFFDPSNYYLIREVQKHTANGQQFEQIRSFSNFKKLPEGVVMPMSMGLSGVGEITIKKFEINPKVDESIFEVG